jgi:hypothetical protein
MVDRIQLTALTFMPLDGQWQLVKSGTVIDVPDAAVYRGASTILSPAEPAGTLKSHGKPTPVRTRLSERDS